MLGTLLWQEEKFIQLEVGEQIHSPQSLVRSKVLTILSSILLVASETRLWSEAVGILVATWRLVPAEPHQ